MLKIKNYRNYTLFCKKNKEEALFANVIEVLNNIVYKVPVAVLFQNVNTEVCEQLFSWLSRFAPMTKHMNRWRFLFLILYLIDNHNEDVTRNVNW